MAVRVRPEDVSDAEWDRIAEIARVLEPLLDMPKRRTADVARAATQLGISVASAYRRLKKLELDRRVTALLPGTPGPAKGVQTLDPDLERVLQSCGPTGFCA